MDKQVLFLDMFSNCTLDQELWSEVRICGAEIEPQERRLTVDIFSPVYLPFAVLNDVRRQIRNSYAVEKVELRPKYAAQTIAQALTRDFVDILTHFDAAARPVLAGSRWELNEQKIKIHLAANGKDRIEPLLPRLSEKIRTMFDVTPEIDIVANSVDGEALYEETEKMRLEAVRNVPAPVFAQKQETSKAAAVENPELIMGRPFSGEATPMSELSLDMFRVIVEGEVFAVNHRELKKRNAWVISFDITDHTGSVRINQFMEADKAAPILEKIKKPGGWLRVQGKMSFDRYENENVLQPQAIMVGKKRARQDTAPDKRVELHLHTKMSNMDALTDVGKAVAQAAAWGHKAIAITDHGVAQAYPDAMHAVEWNKNIDIKILYGCEAYFVNDVDDRIVVHGQRDLPLTEEFVAFDLETTGLSSEDDVIIEIGAVIYRNGEMTEKFQSFVDPHRPITAKISELTGITADMLQGAADISEVLPKFLEFCGDRPLVAHNADFDVGFILAACKRLGIDYKPVYMDTLILAQNLLPELKSHKLNIVADALSLPDFNHHRAVDDAITVGYMLQQFFARLSEHGITDLSEINEKMIHLRSGNHIMDRQARHMILFAKNQTGLRNLYRLISYAHLKYFLRVPRIPKSELMQWREGLIVGSACEAGELFQAIVARKSDDELLRIASFYDFLEIQPIANNRFMLAKGLARDEEELREFNKTVIRLGKRLNKPVVATGDVHFLNPEDEIYRRMLLATKGFEDCDRENPLYFRTTDDMLEEFSYLGEELAYEVVVTNTNLIADMCDDVRPVPHKLFAPAIENSVEDLNRLVYGRLHELYGDEPNSLITKRVETEMHDIISCHYDVIYMSAQKLVQNSLEHGYLVGSRGSVGSSIVAYLSGITEVNSFPPHYRCPACKFHTFEVPEGYACGADLPDAVCPQCGTPFAKEGFAIPFETFLGFGGDKVP